MDQKLIFVAMMLFIVPFAAALGKNLSFVLFLKKMRQVYFRRDRVFGGEGV